jgi:hypothetical protein
MNAQPPRRIDQPEPGTFKLKMIRNGPWIAGRISHAMGFWSASIGGEPCGPRHPDPFQADGVSRIWESAVRIEQAEYDALLRSPPATPDLPINLGALPPISFEAPMSLGRNRPVIDLHAALEPEALKAWISDKLDPHSARADELTARYKQFLLATSAGIANDNVDERTVDFAEQIRREIAATDATRVTIKAPVLAAQKAIDGAAKVISDRLMPAFTEVKARHSAYLIAKDAEIRRLAAEAAARAEEAAYHLQQQAEAILARTACPSDNDNEVFEQADVAIGEQQAAEAIVFAPTLELTRMRTANGVSSGLKDDWQFEITDLALVPAAYLQLNEAIVKAAIKSGTRHVPGLKIFNRPRAR